MFRGFGVRVKDLNIGILGHKPPKTVVNFQKPVKSTYDRSFLELLQNIIKPTIDPNLLVYVTSKRVVQDSQSRIGKVGRVLKTAGGPNIYELTGIANTRAIFLQFDVCCQLNGTGHLR